MPIVLNAWDPRNNNVVMYEERYLEHIVTGHPGIEIDDIRETIEHPDFITDDETKDLVEIYYKHGVVPFAPDNYLKVCVLVDSDKGKVRTAYLVHHPKPTERISWKP